MSWLFVSIIFAFMFRDSLLGRPGVALFSFFLLLMCYAMAGNEFIASCHEFRGIRRAFALVGVIPLCLVHWWILFRWIPPLSSLPNKETERILLQQYKQILRSIVPPDMLTSEGLLKLPSGEGKPIKIRTSGTRACYAGALPVKTIRHRIERVKASIPESNYRFLKRFVEQNLDFEGSENLIDVGGAKHRGVLAHEAFHDIQGYLYDHAPDVMVRLAESLETHRQQVEAWLADPQNTEWSGPGNYQVSDLYAKPGASTLSSSLVQSLTMALMKKEAVVHEQALEALGQSVFEIGRNEIIPVLLGAASEGSESAARIVKSIFGGTGLNTDFYDTLPRA